MPAQKRPHPSSAAPGWDGGHVEGGGGAPAPASGPADAGASNGGARSPKLANGAGAAAAEQQQEEKDRRRDDSDADDEEEEGEGGDRGGVGGGSGGGSGDGGDEDCDSQSSQSDGDVNEFIVVKLTDIRKEVQCPICLGIIRKTRTVMECLHRFCRDCIDKSMRLGNNECPACRTHCASRRSLRDDPNYDSLILALYPDIDKYEEEELAFSEEERTRNKKIQESIAETYRRQSEALVKKRSAAKATGSTYLRRTRGNMRARRRGRTSSPDIVPTDVDDEDKEENGNDGSKESSSVDDHSQDVRPKRSRRWPVSRHSPAKTVGSIDSSFEDSDDLGGGRDILTTSPLRGEMLAWGKNGTRSQTRHGNASSSSGRMAKGGRVAKLVDHLRNADAFDSKFNSYLVLLPLDEQSMPKLEKPYLSCQPTFSIGHLCQFVALELSRQPKEVQIYMRKNSTDGCSPINNNSADEAKPDQLNGLERLWEDKSLSELYPSLASNQGDLELLYSLKAQG